MVWNGQCVDLSDWPPPPLFFILFILPVIFNDCTSRTRTLFDSSDKRFRVETDGTVKMKRQVTLHDGHKRFSVHGWDSQGRKYTVAVRVEHEQHQHHHHHHQVDLHQVTTGSTTLTSAEQINTEFVSCQFWVLKESTLLFYTGVLWFTSLKTHCLYNMHSVM